MGTSFILFLVGGITLTVLGIILRRDGKKSSNAKNHGYGLVSIFLGSYLLIIGSAHSFLRKAAWTDDSLQLFLYILSGTTLLFAVMFGISLLLHSLKSSSKIGLISAAIWTISAISVAVIAFFKVSSMNDGWTSERQKRFIDKCKSEDKYDCDCTLKIIKSTYPNPEDYNAVIDDETKNSAAISTLKDKFNSQCLKCDSAKMKRETLTIDLPI
ncbi:MAG: hypothetical protein FJX80_12715 [Bacteroidetes bacterium]|nr:hypothetical protein [Bacteroidota bacterium]